MEFVITLVYNNNRLSLNLANKYVNLEPMPELQLL